MAEQLLKNDEPGVSLQGLIDFMHAMIKENAEAVDENPKEESVI